jgi:hypothetical protein
MADVRAVATYEAGMSSGQRAGCCQWLLFAESTEALRQCLSRRGEIEMVRLLCIWSSRLRGVPVTVYYYCWDPDSWAMSMPDAEP